MPNVALHNRAAEITSQDSEKVLEVASENAVIGVVLDKLRFANPAIQQLR